jgi:hypothetical protein
MKFKDIFIGFRNSSFEQIAQLFADKKISAKENFLFIATCENSVNAVLNIINGFNAQKDLTENDFDWLIKAYTSSCIRELYDIFDNVKREGANSEIIKNTIDIDFSTAIEHFKIIIGGEDVKKYFDTTLEFIKSSDKDAKNFEEFLLGRTACIFIMLKENNVKLDLISPEQLLEIAQNNYDNSIKNFIKICCQPQK